MQSTFLLLYFLIIFDSVSHAQRQLLGCYWDNSKKKSICGKDVVAKKKNDGGGGGGGGIFKHNCIGKNKVMGVGEVDIIGAFGSTALQNSNGIRLLGSSRNYLSQGCDPNSVNPKNYSKFFLLGKSFSWTTDLSKAGCKCVGALYFVNMAQNTKKSAMNDYYCDAAGVGGVHCTEIDVQEANSMAWHSVLHQSQDPNGKDGGYGGGENSWSGPRDWTSSEYGVGGSCINTKFPFKVNAYFPIDKETQQLSHMKVILTQGKCSLKTRDIGSTPGGHSFYSPSQMKSISDGMKLGLTPVFSSYFPSQPMGAQWLSGQGKDKKGPCGIEQLKNSKCGEVFFSDFKIEPISNSD